MARLIDEGRIAQLSKKQGYFLKYFPARIRNVGEDAKEDRKLIYAFKDARDDAYKLVAQMVDGYLKREYGEQVKDMVFLCVPASRQEVNKSRYKEFCKEVSRLSGIKNGYSHLILMEDRLAVHERRRGREKEISKVSIMDFDKPFFKGKQVLIFDDIITTGGSYAIFAEEVIKLKEELKGVKLVAVIPYRGQSGRWTPYQRERYQRILNEVDEEIVLSEGYYNGCLLKRNDYMLAHASGIIAYYDGKPKGGTFYTCRKARLKGLDIINLYR